MKRSLVVVVILVITALNVSAVRVENVTTVKVLGYDGFEDNTVVDPNAYTSGATDADPDNANPGTWSVVEDNTGTAQVTDYATPGAYEGNNYLRLYRNSGMPLAKLAVVEQTNTNDHIHFEMMVQSSIITKNNFYMNFIGKTSGGVEQNAIAIAFQANGPISVHNGGGYVATGSTWTTNEWSKFEVDWLVGADTCTVTFNGTISAAMGIYKTDTISFTGVKLGASAAGGGLVYIDAVMRPTPSATTKMFVNTTTGTLLGYDGFEDNMFVDTNAYNASATDANPDNANPGIWNLTETHRGSYQVTDYPIAGGTCEGVNYLRMNRLDADLGPVELRAVEQTTLNDAIHFEMMFQFSSLTRSAGVHFRGKDYSGVEQDVVYMLFEANGVFRNYIPGNTEAISGVTWTTNGWNKLEIDWLIGADTYSLTYDGTTVANIDVRNTDVASLTSCALYCGYDDVYIDAVPPARGTLLIIQ